MPSAATGLPLAAALGVTLTGLNAHLHRLGARGAFADAEATREWSSPTKRCRACSRDYPRTAEHFYRQAANGDGLGSVCKTCSKAARRSRPRGQATAQPWHP